MAKKEKLPEVPKCPKCQEITLKCKCKDNQIDKGVK